MNLYEYYSSDYPSKKKYIIAENMGKVEAEIKGLTSCCCLHKNIKILE